tara:strand:+ start:990 stop:1178 length:189 start_codon:yes stop_codon:yes gene_type:complete
MNNMNKKNIKIMLIKSGIGRKSDQKQTLIGLGLTRVGKVRELEDTPSVRGMVKKVSHLVKII